MTTIAIREDVKELMPRLRAMKDKKRLILESIENLADKLEKTLEYTNAKVYDVSYYTYNGWEEDFPILEQSEVESEFQWFCEREWEYFTDESANEFFAGINRDYIGSTSSFRMVGKYLSELETNFNGNEYYQQLLDITEVEEIILESYLDNDDYYEDLAEKIYEYIEDSESNLDNAEYILECFQDEFKQVRRLYQQLKSFKDNQVDQFKEYLEGRVEDIEMHEPERRIDVVNFTSYQTEENYTYSAMVSVHKSLLKEFLEKFNAAIELNGKSCKIDYAVALNLISWLENQETEEYFEYSQTNGKKNGI